MSSQDVRAAPPPGRSATLAYAAGSFGTGVFSTIPSILLLYFATEVLHIAPGLAAVAVFLPKAWAVLWDPFVGAWSDRTSTRFGRRRPFLVAGAIGVCLAFIALFTPPSLGPWDSFLWVAVAYFALTSLYSLFAVPYVALPAEVGDTREVRARMVGWRMVVAMIGVLAGAGVAPFIVQAGGGGRAGYGLMALCFAAACLITMSAPLLMLGRRDRARPSAPATAAPGARLLGALASRPFRRLTAAYVLALTAVGVFSAATPYFITRALGRGEADIGTAMIVMLVVTTLTVPAWSWAARKFGERAMLVAAVLGFCAASAAVAWLAHAGGGWTTVLVAYAIAGLPFAGIQVLPYAMAAHLIHAETRSGAAGEGAFTGVWTAAEKLGLAAGPALTGSALGLVHGDIPGGLALFALAAPAALGLLAVFLLITGPRLGAPRVEQAA